MWPFKKKEKTTAVDKIAVNTQRIMTLIEDDEVRHAVSGRTNVMESAKSGIRATRYLTTHEVYVNDIYLKDVDATLVFNKMVSIYINRENIAKRKQQEEQNKKLRGRGFLV